MNTVKQDSEFTHFRELASKLGGSIYEIDVGDIEPKHSIRLKCQVPLCEYYDVCKVCPPHIPGVDEFKEALLSYSKAFLVVYREKIENLDTYKTDFTAELKLAEIVSAIELSAFSKGYCQALGLCVGGCKLCTKCTPPGQPCRHPYKARSSPEGFGIDITSLARNAGVPIEWPPVEYVSFLGLVLI